MKGSIAHPKQFDFQSWSFYPAEGIIESQNKELILEPRLARLLTSLLRHRRMARREVLVQDIWPDTIVNDESLNRAIADLRKKFKNFFPEPPQIETIPKIGYRIHVEDPAISDSIGKRLVKFSAYALLGLLLLIILIRAIRY